MMGVELNIFRTPSHIFAQGLIIIYISPSKSYYNTFTQHVLDMMKYSYTSLSNSLVRSDNIGVHTSVNPSVSRAVAV